MKAFKLKQFALVIALCAFAANALAASPISICVSNTSDAGEGSLRAAITQANNAGGGNITFSITNTITLASPLPSLTNITITGPGTNLLTISGSNQFRVFAMNSGTTNTLSGLTIANGRATGYEGPELSYMTYASGISNAGSLKLLNCAVSNCTTYLSFGGGIYNAGDMEMEASSVADSGPFKEYYDTVRGGGIYNSGSLRMTNCRVSGCGADWNAMAGGGILNMGNLTMITTVVEDCGTGIDGDGGGIFNQGTAVLCGCTVANCSSDWWGGGIRSGGSLAITNSTIVDNYDHEEGGGLMLWGTNWLVNCTISGNRSGFDGGGICQGKYGLATTVYANHCTIVSNALYVAGRGGGVDNQSGVFDCSDSIIADNGTNDFSGVLISEGYNLIQNTNGCTITSNQTGNIYGADPLLGPLRDNGGPTWTHALLPGSPAIDAGNTEDTLAFDQRGIPRPQGLAPDIGAFEFQYATPVLVRMVVQSCTNRSLKLCGLRGGIYTLQASTDLVSWVNVATNMAGTSGVCEFTESDAARCPRRFYRVSVPVPPGAVYIPAPSGILDAPFLITDPYISQLIYTDLTNAGRAEYPFVLPRAGNYILQATVNAADASVNSLFVNIDAEPQDPTMIWDVLPCTSGFESRTVNWRGNGIDTSDQFVPIVFTLSQGTHKLIILGREGWTLLQDMAVVPSLAPYLPATSGLVAPPFIITNDYIYQPTETGVADGGRAAYTFTIPNAGAYVIRAVVNAPNASANSFFVNVDAEPQDPYMVWDIPVTTGFEQREVSWRGNGTPTNSQFVPKVFNLTQGVHQLIIRGREQYTLLRSMTIMQYP